MKNLILKLIRKYILKPHKYPTSTLIQRKNGSVVFEVEFNWFDEILEPVSIVRDIKTQKIYSVRSLEMHEFKEYTGSDPNGGVDI